MSGGSNSIEQESVTLGSRDEGTRITKEKSSTLSTVDAQYYDILFFERAKMTCHDFLFACFLLLDGPAVPIAMKSSGQITISSAKDNARLNRKSAANFLHKKGENKWLRRRGAIEEINPHELQRVSLSERFAVAPDF